MSATANGYPLPLFERLVEDADAWLQGEDALRQSVARELSRLLNARSSLSMDAFARSDGTVLDYGLPDFSDLSLRSAPDREAIVAAVRRAIALFEPRLTDVKVAFTFASGNEQHAVLAIDGTMRVNQSVEHVFFELQTHSRGAADARWTDAH
ncbi:type VI secretion system baseplate subunit TssE [Paraburkholderia panacisoli]|uniref:Type VI secretion system baseplate subunit TssE n=1 Tax=Paraburkholderia panacisoli TaxID=2603818 RepID=A0A5B0GA40_9BURK|nr:type VI secretion system baseplate subunit TssE [Paraburkholderia panacisoli]KAA0998900.1 type VI secretion system baseplate subunit TssE [Paraburkholderia panacisoli]